MPAARLILPGQADENDPPLARAAVMRAASLHGHTPPAAPTLLQVMTLPPIDPVQFVSLVEPLLQSQDMEGLLSLLKTRWNPDQISDLLHSNHRDARKVALLAIGLVGGKCCIEELAAQLKDSDPMINQLAEHALWSIWFRAAVPEANHEVCRGTQALNRGDLAHAIKHFDRAIEMDKDFAEAYNQRAIAYYLQENYPASIQDCRRTVNRMSCHFGAWAGMGHAQLHLGRLTDAIESYERAVAINPHLDCICQTIDELRRQINEK